MVALCWARVIARMEGGKERRGEISRRKIGEGTELPGTGTGVLRCMYAGGVGRGMWRDQRVSVLLLDPVRKGVGESRVEKETAVGVTRAVPSVPIRALTCGQDGYWE